MALEVPTAFQYDNFMSVPGDELRDVLLRDSRHNLRWRGDASDRIHGGARRTYLPHPDHAVDRLFFGGGTAEFHRVVDACLVAANTLMGTIVEDGSWHANRVVINKMPPLADLVEHVDPVHFDEGVVVIGAGEALFHHRSGGEEWTILDPPASILYVPPGVSHWVENLVEERVSVVVAKDAQLASGMSAVGQKISSLLHR